MKLLLNSQQTVMLPWQRHCGCYAGGEAKTGLFRGCSEVYNLQDSGPLLSLDMSQTELCQLKMQLEERTREGELANSPSQTSSSLMVGWFCLYVTTEEQMVLNSMGPRIGLQHKDVILTDLELCSIKLSGASE